MPVRLAAEARATQTDSGTEVRPAADAVTELPPVALPLGARGEAYLQVGYVGGRFGTGFIDGQARIDRSVASVPGGGLSAGVAAWGGAQKGVARLDIGPTRRWLSAWAMPAAGSLPTTASALPEMPSRRADRR
jgi:hypothetical protein